MKNKNLWLSFIIAVGAMFLLTWLIPSTSYNDSGVLTLGAINPSGIWDVFYYLAMVIAWFYQNIIFIIIIGVFYGVINKTGALRFLVERTASQFKKHEKRFLLISSSFFILVSALTGINFLMLFFVPLFAGVILSLGYNKITALIATIGSILVGFMGSLYCTTLFTSISSYVDAGISYGWYKAAMLVAGLVIVNLYLFFTAKIAKGKEKDELNEGMLFIEKIDGMKKQKVWPLVTAFVVILVLFILGLTPWSSMYSFTGFSDIHTKFMGIKIGSFAIFKSIFGSSLAAFGSWTVADAAALIVITTIVLAIVYKVKWEEVFNGIVDGIVKLLPTIILVLAANIVFILASQSGILNTIIHFFTSMTKGINLFTYAISSFIGAAIVNDNYITSYVVGTMDSVLGSSANLPLLVLIQQAMYGLAVLIAPTGALLLAGLSYFEVGYTKWVKNIWKLFLILLVVSMVILALAIML